MKDLSRSALLLALMAMMTACETYEETPGDAYVTDDPVAADSSRYDEAWQDFLVAWDELDACRRATPEWEYPHRAAPDLTGFGHLCEVRVAALEPYVPHRRISPAAVELTARHVRRASLIDLPTAHDGLISADLDPADRLDFDADERAYHLMERDLPLLDAYVAAGIGNEWLETWVLPEYEAAARRLVQSRSDSPASWSQPRDAADLDAMRARCDHLLTGLSAVATGRPRAPRPMPTPPDAHRLEWQEPQPAPTEPPVIE